jgi:hypothetical protein
VGAISHVFDNVRKAAGVEGNLASVQDLSDKNLWTIFPPANLGGSAFIGDQSGNVIGITDKNYDFDLRSVGREVIGKFVPPTMRLKKDGYMHVHMNDLAPQTFDCPNDFISHIMSTLAQPHSAFRPDLTQQTTADETLRLRQHGAFRFKLSERVKAIGPKAAKVALWHVILGHPSKVDMLEIINNGRVILGLDITAQDVHLYYEECIACIRGKMKATPYEHREQDPDEHVGSVVELDIYGKIEPQAIGGHNYLINAIDRHSAYTVDRARKLKDGRELAAYIKELHKHYADHGHQIKIIRTDSEAVMKCPDVKQAIATLAGVTLQHTASHCHLQAASLLPTRCSLGSPLISAIVPCLSRS